jgi:hypothetical protein
MAKILVVSKASLQKAKFSLWQHNACHLSTLDADKEIAGSSICKTDKGLLVSQTVNK